MMAVPKLARLLFLLCTAATFATVAAAAAAATWCVARSDASDEALQTALDYACGGGADCAPILPSGLCYLPNTMQAHASYAFNSYYQRKGNAPDACSFSGTSAIARTDPSYGSCVYPSSASAAGGTVSPGGPPIGPTTPVMNGPPSPPPGTTMPLYGSEGKGPLIPDSSNGSKKLSTRIIFSPLTFLFIFLYVS